MKSMAAINIRHFETAVNSLQEYNRVIDLGWRALFRSGGGILPSRKCTVGICLVMGSDQGMCGQFNESLLGYVLEQLPKTNVDTVQMEYWCVGDRIRAGLEDIGVRIDETFLLPGSLSGINNQVQEIVQTFEARQQKKGCRFLIVFYNQMGKGGWYQAKLKQLLPLDTRWSEKYRDLKWPNRCLPLLGLPSDFLFGCLFRYYLFASLYQAFAQSMASENVARLRSMQAAEKNIIELNETLQARFRETRQSIITAELLDIISGFEAVSSNWM